MTDRADIYLVCAVEREASPLLARGELIARFNIPGLLGWNVRFGGRRVMIAAGGMGYTNAAQTLTQMIVRHGERPVIGFGIAGAPRDGGATPGSVVIADEVVYGDVGVETDAGWIDARGIGIPLGEGADGPFFNTLPCHIGYVDALRAGANAKKIPSAVGPVVSASTGSGNRAAQRRLHTRYRALAEEMEGAALAHVAALHGCPFGLVRGISNWSGERDMASWRIDDAAEVAARLLADFLEEAAL